MEKLKLLTIIQIQNLSKVLQLVIIFNKIQRIKFKVFDYDSETQTSLIGEFETTLREIMSTRKRKLEGDLKLPDKDKIRGIIILSCDKVKTCNDMIYFDLHAINLPSKKKFCFFGSNNPFFYIERTRSPDSQEYVKVIQSECQHNTTNPEWLCK